MQAKYPKKEVTPHWDPVRVLYPVKKFPGTGVSSETIGHRWRDQPEIIPEPKTPIDEIKNYFRDYNITKQLTNSETSQEYDFKFPEIKRFNKHTSCAENLYIYPPSRKLSDRVPKCSAHGVSEMRSSFTTPEMKSRLVTDKDQFKHPASLLQDLPPVNPSWRTELEPLDTTHEGYEKYLDPYLTTNRLHHRPYTAEQLEKLSNSKDIVTYYTLANIPWTRTSKPCSEWRLPLSRPKSMYDREKFKQDFREIRFHNKMKAVPGTFRTETRDNYVAPILQPTSQIHNYEEETRSHYEKSLAKLLTNKLEEQTVIRRVYATENSIIGSKRPVCSTLDQHTEKNKRLERKSVK